MKYNFDYLNTLDQFLKASETPPRSAPDLSNPFLFHGFFSAIPIPLLKFSIFYSSSLCTFYKSSNGFVLLMMTIIVDKAIYISVFNICQVQCKLCCYQIHFTAFLLAVDKTICIPDIEQRMSYILHDRFLVIHLLFWSILC